MFEANVETVTWSNERTQRSGSCRFGPRPATPRGLNRPAGVSAGALPVTAVRGHEAAAEF